MYITARSLVSHDQSHVTVDHITVTQIKDYDRRRLVASANTSVRVSSVRPSVRVSVSHGLFLCSRFVMFLRNYVLLLVGLVAI